MAVFSGVFFFFLPFSLSPSPLSLYPNPGFLKLFVHAAFFSASPGRKTSYDEIARIYVASSRS